jgi:O-acetyl-ADP-ribose deacetylase (regulator of RNase III)
VNVAAEHIEQTIKGEQPESRKVDCMNMPNGALISRYMKLTAVRPRLEDLQRRLVEEFAVGGRTRIASTLADDSDNTSTILTLHGPQDAIDRAFLFARSNFLTLCADLNLTLLTDLHAWDVDWLSKNLNLPDDSDVVMDIYTPETAVLTDDIDTDLKCRCKIGDVELLIVCCDFLDTAMNYGCDTIINSANGQLRHSAGIARAIANAAGSDLRDECTLIGDVRVTQAVVTGSHLLSSNGFKRIVHAVAPIMTKSSDSNTHIHRRMVATVGNALTCSLIENSASVAIPGMGMGIYGWSIQDAARSIVLGISEWAGAVDINNCIKRIVLFDNSPEKVDGFVQAIRDLESGELLKDDAFSSIKTSTILPPGAAPVLPEFQWLRTVWPHEVSGNPPGLVRELATTRGGNCKVVPYDYDQNLLLEIAYQRGDDSLELIGDLNGIANNKKYVVDFKEMTQTTTPQFNLMSVRPLFRVRVNNACKDVPLYITRVSEYNAIVTLHAASQADAVAAPPIRRVLPSDISCGALQKIQSRGGGGGVDALLDARKDFSWLVSVFGNYGVHFFHYLQ